MSRVARVVAAGFPHHVTQRGNRQADVFETDEDREAYQRFIEKYCARRGLAVWAYCLMTNHVHLVVVPRRDESLGQALRDAHTVYSMYFNSRTGLTGTSGSRGSTLVHLTNRTCGRRCGMWS